MRYFLFLLLFCVSNAVIWSQTIDQKSLDTYFDLLSENNQFMGTVVIQNDSTEYSRAIGLRDIDKDLENTPATVFRLGSISKMFTATMIFQLVEEGKLKLNTSLAEFFPLLQHSEEITIGQMLRHQSGLFDFTSDIKYASYMFTEKSRKDLLTILRLGSPAFLPGEKAEYCNTNFLLLSYIIEDLDEISYSESLKSRITDPIGTRTIAYGQDANTANNESLSYMYTGDFWQFAGQTHMSIPMGAGAIVGNAADVNTFIRALLHSETLITEDSRKQMLETVGDRYGHGIFELPFDKLKAYGHGGSIDGFRTRTAYILDSNTAITILSNGLNYDMREIADTMINAVTGADLEFPILTEIELPAEKLNRYPGHFVSEGLPIKIDVTLADDGRISIQATGQQAFTLTTDGETEFSLLALGLQIVFDDLQQGKYQKFTLRQGGGEFAFNRVSKTE